MSHRPQHTRRTRRLAGRLTAGFAVLAIGAGVAFALWPTSGSVDAAPAVKVAAPSPLPAASTTAHSEPGADASTNHPSRPATKPSTRRVQPRPAKHARAVTGQRVTVTARRWHATVAVVRRWVHRAGRWVRVGHAMHAHIGVAGVTRHPSEKLAATPAGSYSLTQAFGAAPNTAHHITKLRYIHIRYGDSWGSKPKRRTYNRYFNCHCPHATLFALRHSLFRYGMVIDYNRAPIVPGAGSGFFVHVTNGRPTAGCVALPARNVRTLLHWLRPDLHPRIRIRVARR